ncbi:unnamed protein product [Heligmosomoides polygyrus]|uniref:Reverse transcriptase domain-containing protein n=1 Tax=Heligmosomoides polygyrus TaxID=6339 RepID=A0A183G7K7_HELPZ|nr:unnamed protein product [Heligmosomoides polygyrus]
MVKAVKNADGRVLRKPVEVRKRWEEYFKELLSDEFPRRDVEEKQLTEGSIPSWTQEEVRNAIGTIKLGKAAEPDGVPVESWKVRGNCGVNWLTQFSYRVTIEGKMPDYWRDSSVAPIFKQKGDASECSNYRGIKHDEGLRTTGRLEAEGDGGGVPERLISVIRDMYEGSKAAVRTLHGMTKKMDITGEGTLRKALSEPSANDIVLVADSREELEEKVQLWQGALADNSLRLNVRKTKLISSDQCNELILTAKGRTLKGKLYRTVVRQALLYGGECWDLGRAQKRQPHAAEMRMLRWACGWTRRDRVRNEDVSAVVKTAPVQQKMRKQRLRWLALDFEAPGKRPRRATKKRWKYVIKRDLAEVCATADDVVDRMRAPTHPARPVPQGLQCTERSGNAGAPSPPSSQTYRTGSFVFVSVRLDRHHLG